MCFLACPRPQTRYEDAVSGHSAAWLARPSGGRKVGSSNLPGPTNTDTARMATWVSGRFHLGDM
jgi:hypothetical protein